MIEDLQWRKGKIIHVPPAKRGNMRGYLNYCRKPNLLRISAWRLTHSFSEGLECFFFPLDVSPRWRRLHSSFDYGFPVQIGGPVHQVEGPKQHGEHYPGHLVDLTHAVVSLFGVWGLALGGLELHGRAVGNGSDGGVFCEVGGVIHTGWAAVVWLFRQSQWVLFLWSSKE